MALPDQHSDLKPVYDKDAAVKYVVYNGNQWVSYNDADTLKQKIDWANNLGLGGSLIWASDAGKPHCAFIGRRKKADCCKVETLPKEPLICDLSLYSDDPGLCQLGEDGAFGSSGKRDLKSGDGFMSDLQFKPRGPKRQWDISLLGLAKSYQSVSRSNPNRGDLDPIPTEDTSVQNEAVDTSNPPTNAKVEHPIDLQVHVRFTESANLGRRPSGAPSNTPALSTQFFLTAYFSNTGLPAGLPRVAADSPNLRRPEQCVWEAYGSYMNSRNFILTAAELNSVKGQLFGLTFPIRDNRYCQLVRDSIAGNRTSTNVFLQGLRATMGVFQYLNDPGVFTRFNNVRNDIRFQYQLLEQIVPAVRDRSALG
ncbi:glycoside hydrolase family 18 protein [Lepidopterella palustris CBS 459.81]|uniref:Glycoside hydrolase family 18 protein n=1 Tax=Lepidopterella palustris CBS 459.81 TaxID=1314670 RepID=A0A8E2JBX4_9PEZI|nr:glycoside hydrolase family 18 protein [Lepidopterella palustris CBS 459.81]